MRRAPALFWLPLWLASFATCGELPPPLPDPDPGLADLALTDLGPRTIVPGTEIILVGRSLPSPGDGSISLLLAGTMKAPELGKSKFEVRLRAEYKSASEARVVASGELFAALGATDGTIDGTATLIVDSAIEVEASLGSPGFDDLAWLKPVRPGDMIRARMTCIDKTPSRSRPGIGSARFLVEAFNQNDELVMRYTSIGIMRFRNPA